MVISVRLAKMGGYLEMAMPNGARKSCPRGSDLDLQMSEGVIDPFRLEKILKFIESNH